VGSCETSPSWFHEPACGDRTNVDAVPLMLARRRGDDAFVVILILYYLGFMVVGGVVAFLALYFVSLWTAWKLSVWMTEPKKQTA
jgi:hypothetical protein